MRKLLCIIKFIIVEIESILWGGVKIGFTGSMNAVPIISTKNKGRINVGKHCLFEKCRLAAVNGGEILVGEGTSLGRNTIIVAHERISIGQNCSLAPNICIYDHDHCFNADGKTTGFNTGKVYIGNNVWIGAGVIILRNTSIGNNCVIGAGTVVKGDIPNNSLVTGERKIVVKKLR